MLVIRQAWAPKGRRIQVKAREENPDLRATKNIFYQETGGVGERNKSPLAWGGGRLRWHVGLTARRIGWNPGYVSYLLLN